LHAAGEADAACGLWPDLTPEEIVQRELQEEAGGDAAELHYVGQFYTSNGISNEVAYVYLGTGVACPDCSWSGSWAGRIPR
jgi:8-oxo-dGTP pyrophosphatase MutT (NUDIX family)